MIDSITITIASNEHRSEMIQTMLATADQELAWLNFSHNDTNDVCYIILTQNKPVGYCLFRRSSAEIRRLFVLPEHRRFNIGSFVLNQLLARFKIEGFKSITIQFSDDYVAAFLTQSLKYHSVFSIEEGMIIVSII
jgi:GNAT superfamily N-acetyltransferase